MDKYEDLGKGVVRRTQRRTVGLFIDGTGLDRAARRLGRRVDMAALVRGVTSGMTPIIARYYTLIPYEDDNRQRAFLDAVARAGLDVVVKRLPPKGINRQVSVDIEIAADLVAFAFGQQSFGDLGVLSSGSSLNVSHGSVRDSHRTHLGDHGPGAASAGSDKGERGGAAGIMPFGRQKAAHREGQSRGSSLESGISTSSPLPTIHTPPAPARPEPTEVGVEAAPTVDEVTPLSRQQIAGRVITVVCPGRDLAYPLAVAKSFGADTVTADFGQFNTGDVLKSAAKWIDLSDSETIWLPERHEKAAST